MTVAVAKTYSKRLFACLIAWACVAASSGAEPGAKTNHWAFLPINHAAPPVRLGHPAESPIDAFLQAKLAELGIRTVEPASRTELLRRATYDVTGLPPTPSELRAFLADDSPEAWEKVIDRLLASSAYGERWAQHWLDLAHYADSNGFELDADRPDAWRYRDWVINALNGDMPYDRFLTLQVAGDETSPGDHEALIASGFGRAGPREVVSGNIDPEVRRQNELTEATTTIGSVFLGLTIGCARCHDHKFDPLSAADYYALEAFFAGTQLKDAPIYQKREKEEYERRIKEIHARTQPFAEEKRKLEAPYLKRLQEAKEAALTAQERAIRAKPKEQRTPEEERLFEGTSVALKVSWEEIAAEFEHHPEDHRKREELKHKIHDIEKLAPKPPAAAMAMAEESCKLPETWVLSRGNIKNKRKTVEPRPPAVLRASMGRESFVPPDAPIDNCHSGWRLALARWMTATNNPLTARVIVNRVWQHYFGRGLAATTSDFGTRGDAPSHPALLDFLASELMENGWRLKPLHRAILASRAYQLSSGAGASNGARLDPDNHFLWRMNRKRMDAEALRDSILAASGVLNREPGGPGVLIHLEPEVRSLIFTEQEVVDLWPADERPAQHQRRSIYVYRKRNVHYPMFDAFDAPDALTPCPVRPVSTHAPQALVLLNSQFAQQTARAFAANLLQLASSQARVEDAFLRCYARPPSTEELAEALAFIATSSGSESEKWSDLALALLNSNEFVYVP